MNLNDPHHCACRCKVFISKVRVNKYRLRKSILYHFLDFIVINCGCTNFKVNIITSCLLVEFVNICSLSLALQKTEPELILAPLVSITREKLDLESFANCKSEDLHLDHSLLTKFTGHASVKLEINPVSKCKAVLCVVHDVA